ncbi:eukaryotic translation initiation factor 4B1-like [Typha latifolia]|uniref:eukaryotic translation initiation factor 4B1-like n=1 Tax=Typha latifolia TaxID=4733 RepID=UPI003C2F7A33
MSKPWGGVGAWALEAERAEAEEREAAAAAAAATSAAADISQSFPSLKEAAAAVGKPKKKKATPLSLAEFGTYVGPAGGRRNPSVEPRGLTHDEILLLPTGPRERSAEELDRSRLGGGFRSYGYNSRRTEEGEGLGSRRQYGAGFDDEQRRGPSARVSDLDQPSRADEVDNWAANKKSFAPIDSGKGDRYGSMRSNSSSRVDDVDDWSRGKKPIASRHDSFGSGFRDSSGPSDSDRWFRGGSGGVRPQSEERERPRLVLEPPKGDVRVPSESVSTRPSPFGAARPREEVLAEKGLDWRKMDTAIEVKKTSRPTSSHSSRPSSAQSSRPGSPAVQVLAAAGEGASRTRPKVNPFGDAKPREVVLEEKGKDWRKIDLDLEHRGVDRAETAEERMIKEHINHLKKALEEAETKMSDGSAQVSTGITSLREQIFDKEKELELLTTELDDKVRFGQRTTDVRPGSGAGRVTMFSQSDVSEESQSTESMGRPHSRGGILDMRAKPVDDKWGFQGVQDRGSFGRRNSDRSRSRERW